MADLNRNRAAAILPQTNPNAFYRAHGAGGWQDWLDTGKIRANPASKAQYNAAYFSQGAPLERYVVGRSGGTHIIESTSSKIKQLPNKYYGTSSLGKYDPFKVWANPTGKGYEVIYHNQPWKQVAKTAGRSALGTIGGVVAGELLFPAEANAGEDEYIRNINDGPTGASGRW